MIGGGTLIGRGMEAVSKMMDKAVREGHMSGFSVGYIQG